MLPLSTTFEVQSIPDSTVTPSPSVSIVHHGHTEVRHTILYNRHGSMTTFSPSQGFGLIFVIKYGVAALAADLGAVCGQQQAQWHTMQC